MLPVLPRFVDPKMLLRVRVGSQCIMFIDIAELRSACRFRRRATLGTW